MAIRISRFDFLEILNLTQFEFFSPSSNFGASVDHFVVLKLHFLILHIQIEFNILPKSGFKTKLLQFYGNVHIIRNNFGGRGVQRFVTKPCKSIGICRGFVTKGEGRGVRKIVLRIMWISIWWHRGSLVQLASFCGNAGYLSTSILCKHQF
jgi:hypothetical protein